MVVEVKELIPAVVAPDDTGECDDVLGTISGGGACPRDDVGILDVATSRTAGVVSGLVVLMVQFDMI